MNAKVPTPSVVPSPIALDARQWKSKDDFYVDLLAGLRAPEWHGHNLDALWDSLGTGGINEIEPPIAIHISNTAGSPAPVAQILKDFAQLVGELKQVGRLVSLDIVP